MKKLASLLIALALIFQLSAPPEAYAAGVAQDHATATETTSGTSPVTWSFTTAGSNRFLVLALRCLLGDHITGTPTYAGVSMNLAVKQADPVGAVEYLYYLPNPASGSNTVSVSFNISGGENCGGTSASYTGAQQTTGVDTGAISETASGSRTVTVNVTKVGSWLLATHSQEDVAASGGVNCTVFAGNVSGDDAICDSAGIVSTGNQTIGFTWGGSDRHAIIAMTVPPRSGSFNIWQFFSF